MVHESSVRLPEATFTMPHEDAMLADCPLKFMVPWYQATLTDAGAGLLGCACGRATGVAVMREADAAKRARTLVSPPVIIVIAIVVVVMVVISD